jgi:hypothetical protein
MSTEEQLPSQVLSQAPHQASPHEIIGVGVAFGAAGLYFMLGAAGTLPMPETNGPSVIIFCAGLAFVFAGLTCVVRARESARDRLHIESEMTDTGPRWTGVSIRMLAIGATGALAIIGSWVAMGSGPRAFSLSAPFVEMQTAGEAVGRSVFALGAVIAWIYAIALTIGTVRKFFGSSPSPSIVPSEPAEQRPRAAAPRQRERVTTPE